VDKNEKSVDWASLGEPDLPRWLSDLTSADRKVRRDAYNKLIERLTPWPAFDEEYGTPDQFEWALRDDIPLLCCPALIDLLSNGKVPERDNILGVLHNLACYMYAAEIYTSLKNPEHAIFRTRARLLWEAVRRGLPIYASFLNLPDSYIDSPEMLLKEGAKGILKVLDENYLTEFRDSRTAKR